MRVGISIFGFFALAASGSVFADDAYRCSLVGGEEEFTVEINLAAKKAAFFDNDRWYMAEQSDVQILKTNPVTYAYAFEGFESGHSPLTIHFAQQTIEDVSFIFGSIEFSSPSADAGDSYALECEPKATTELWSEIQN